MYWLFVPIAVFIEEYDFFNLNIDIKVPLHGYKNGSFYIQLRGNYLNMIN